MTRYRVNRAALLSGPRRRPLSTARCLGCGLHMAAFLLTIGYRYHPTCAPDDHNPAQKVSS